MDHSRKRKVSRSNSKELNDVVEKPKKRAKKTNETIAGKSKEKVKSQKKAVEKTDDAASEGSDCWDEVEVLSTTEKVNLKVAKNFVQLISDGCTLPFIARYRKASVDNLLPDRLQDLYESYQNICALKKKIKSSLEALKKSKKITPEIAKSILSARSLAELDLIYAPFKSSTLSLAERARNLGLEPYAIKALNGDYIDVRSLCGDQEELSTQEQVEEHITHIVADILYKDPKVLEQMRSLKDETRFTLQSTRSKSTKAKEAKDQKKIDSRSDPETYKLYFDWKCPTQFVKAHQILALNRGEDEKILSVKVIVPDWFYNKLERFCLCQWRSARWVRRGLGDAFARLVRPWLARRVRAELTARAHGEALRTFADNLQRCLLTEPLRGRRVAGLDPGYRHGCKVGVIDTDGRMLEACTIYPDLKTFNEKDNAAKQLREIISNHGVQLLGLGTGTASRETGRWLRAHGLAAVPVVAVPEHGASVYSVSKEAQREHPNMDPNLISALSIARRVLDPMGEFIKVDPKSLGVGLYQHDVSPKALDSALDAAVEKVVSLVGVDLNTASHALLRRISGLNDGRAKKIIDHRSSAGAFTSRQQLLQVPGIGKVSYQQSAGFLRVEGAEPLDATIVHPESYGVAWALAKRLGVNIKDLNKPDFSATVRQKLSETSLEELSADLGAEPADIGLILDAFDKKMCGDGMISFCKPVYSVADENPEEIREGTQLTGVVTNVVPFGCFVDCGAATGLVHASRLGARPPRGARVLVTVLAPPRPRRLELRLDAVLAE